ncbi:hypothetical protein P879_03599 [Paragonimus westermani]|uniref:SOCS box domain-containing protein n=1 Tax=Paragonimus westermani TaxID=34504 RepID=A0A8T0DQ37_9TREM|nr:hypothetical protein P879_03599 [Paragonimus westermani]
MLDSCYDPENQGADVRRIIFHLRNDNISTIIKSVLERDHQPTENEPKWIRENTVFDVSAGGRTLLYLAIVYCADKCVRQLVSPPFLWEPDKPDASGFSPMHLAEDRDDLHALGCMAPFSKELRYLETNERDSRIKRPCTCLVWPQTLWRFPISRYFFLCLHERGIAPSNDEEDAVFANDCRFVSHMCGATVALLLELFMATPYLFTFHIWSGQENLSVEQRHFWPVPPLIEDELREHVLKCQNYPYCLHLQLEESIAEGRNVEWAWRRLSALWRAHRFSSSIRNKASVVERVWGPPLLKDICRETIRRQLVQTTHPSFLNKDGQNLRENYIYLVFRLPIPQELKQFLIYENLWPARDWHKNVQRLGRTEYWALEQEGADYRSLVYGPGLVYGHGFIPLSSHHQL